MLESAKIVLRGGNPVRNRAAGINFQRELSVYRIKRFFNKIIKIVTFIPILWRDEDWDYNYMLQLLQAKLIFMRRYFMNSNIVTKETTKKILSGIDKTLESIKKFTENDSFGVYEVKSPFEITHEFRKCENGPASEFISINKDENREFTEEDEELFKEYLLKITDEENTNWNAIFNTIRDEARGWWD